MKRFTSVVLMLCIALMCTTPFEAQSQNRRTGGNTTNTTQKEQRSSGSSSSSTVTRSSGNSTPQTKMVTPSGQTNRQSQTQPASRSTQTTRSQQPGRSTAPAQVQDRRTTTTTAPNSNSHSAQISRKNSDVGRQNIPAAKPNNPAPKSTATKNNSSRYNDPYYNRPPERKPAAVQYHNMPPQPRGPEYARPFLQPKHPPVPSYAYGNHYFGHRLNVLPRGYVTVRVGNISYYYCDGIYYRPYSLGGYYVCRPPRGTVISQTLLNVALTAVAINTLRTEVQRAQRARDLATVYAATNTAYRVPDDVYYTANLASQANQEYYYEDGVFYILHNGQYYVIEPPIGALVTQIPADYDELELDGRTYYLVEDTLYKTTVIDGALYFEVVSNL